MIDAFKLLGEISLKGGDKVKKGLQGVGNEVDKSGGRLKGFGKAIGALGVAVAGLGAMAGTVGGIVGGVGISFNAMKEQSLVAWETLLGGAKEADTMFRRIQDFTAKTPFETEHVDRMAKFMHNAGLEGDALFKQLMKVSDTASAFAVPAHEATEMARQMSQVQQAGIAYTEDLNILQDRGIPIYGALAEVIGGTTADVKKLASEGKLSSEIYLEAFDNIAIGVAGASDKQSKTFSGMISTMQDGLKVLAGNLTEGLFGNIKDQMPKVLEVIDDFNAGFLEGGLQGGLEAIFPKETADKIIKTIDTVKSNFKKLKDFLVGSFDAIKGNTKDTWETIENVIKWVADFIEPYVKDMLEEVQAFWSEHGEQVMEAVDNFTKFLKTAFAVVMPIIKFLIEGVLGSIIGIFKGAFNLIMGIVKVFTGLFTGDFSLMWEGLKQMFFGAIEFIWNLLSLLFVGRIIGGIKAFIKTFVTNFKAFFTKIGTNAKEGLTKVLTWFKDLFNRGIDTFNLFMRNGVNIFGSIRAGILKIVDDLKTKAVDIATKIYLGIKGKFDNILSTAKSIFGKIKNAITNPIESAKKTISGIVDKIKGFFTGLKIKLPHIKMPKFTIKNWSLNPINWKKNPPKLGITWHKTGALLDRATMIGATGNQMHVGGEAGKEGLLPLEGKHMMPFAEAVASYLGGNKAGARVEVPLIINGREFARAVVPNLDQELERQRAFKKRGV